ncbi:MAG: hypothetical protein HXY24_09850 [Rubrivivax sp.]|nr:hypothetical protein [Rubrivivax sp.]
MKSSTTPRARRVHRQQLAFDLLEPRLELPTECARFGVGEIAGGALPAGQRAAKRRREPLRVARQREALSHGLVLTREFDQDLGERGRALLPDEGFEGVSGRFAGRGPTVLARQAAAARPGRRSASRQRRSGVKGCPAPTAA